MFSATASHIFILFHLAHVVKAFGFSSQWRSVRACSLPKVTLVMGESIDDERKKKLQQLLNSQFISNERLTSKNDEWCKPLSKTDPVGVGIILLANPEPFFEGDVKVLNDFGLQEPIPTFIAPDRQVGYLPCIMIIQHDSSGSVGIMLNRRTSVLMGDLSDDMSAFKIQPIYLGGNAGSNNLSFIHTYPEINGAMKLTEDGLYFGGDFKSASYCVREGTGSGFNFKFFINFTTFAPGQIEDEIESGLWNPVHAGRMSIIRIRDPKGPFKAKPLWTDLMSLASDGNPALKEQLKYVYK